MCVGAPPPAARGAPARKELKGTDSRGTAVRGGAPRPHPVAVARGLSAPVFITYCASSRRTAKRPGRMWWAPPPMAANHTPSPVRVAGSLPRLPPHAAVRPPERGKPGLSADG